MKEHTLPFAEMKDRYQIRTPKQHRVIAPGTLHSALPGDRFIVPVMLISIFLIALGLLSTLDAQAVELTPLGSYESGYYGGTGEEIVAFDAETNWLFVTNSEAQTIDVIGIGDPSYPTLAFTIDISQYGSQANYVAVNNGVLAAAIENANTQWDGSVVFFDTYGNFLNQLTVGPKPEMLTFTPDGAFLLIANEGEPNEDYTNDPLGSVSIIDLSYGVANITQSDVNNVDFTDFDTALLDVGVRVVHPNATFSADAEPECITITANSEKAWVTLQENNAMAVIDIPTATVVAVHGCDFKNHNVAGNGIDASVMDGTINIANWPVFGMFQPDAIANYSANGATLFVTTNEGESRDMSGWSEVTTVGDVTLDSYAFANASSLQDPYNLGDLAITRMNGDTDGDGDYDRLYSFGGRSFSIWNTSGDLVYDSGDEIAQITAAAYPDNFNASDNSNDSFEARSNERGSEPEGLIIGQLDDDVFAFIGLEQIGGVMVYNITDPNNVSSWNTLIPVTLAATLTTARPATFPRKVWYSFRKKIARSPAPF